MATILRIKILSLMGLAAIAMVNAADLDCSKIGALLCGKLKGAQSDTQMFTVLIDLYHPVLDSICRGQDPKDPGTDPKCANGGRDSAYLAKIKADAQKLFSTYELWDRHNPMIRLSAPAEPKEGFLDIIASKATLIKISQEPYINEVDYWDGGEPLSLYDNTVLWKVPQAAADHYLVNGQRVDQKRNVCPKHIAIGKLSGPSARHHPYPAFR